MTPRIGSDFKALDRFVERLRELTPEQWESFARSLDRLRGDDVRTMWRRARHRVGDDRKTPVITGIFAILFVLGELIGEFHPASGAPVDTERSRAYVSSLPPEHRAYIDRFIAAREIGERNRPGEVVLADVLATAAIGLDMASAPGMTREDVEARYAPLEPFILLDSL